MGSPAYDDHPYTFQGEGTATPTLVEGTELIGEFEGTAYREPPQLICRPDGQLVRLPPLLYLVAKSLDSYDQAGAVDGRLSQVAEVVSQRTERHFTADHIAYLVDNKLAPLGVTTYSDGSQPPVTKPKPPWLSLRFRAALFSDVTTSFLGGLFAWLFRPAVVFFAVPAMMVGEVWLFATQNMGAAFQEILLAPASILLVVFLSLVSAAFHEFGHAAACRYGGVRPGAMGCGIYLVWPVLYTDVTNAYRLGRRGRLRTDLGGVYFNVLFILGLTVLYLYSGFGPLLVAVIVTNLEMIRQLLPTLRFDGYYIASDLVGIPDLFKYIGPILKRTLLRLPADARLRALKQWPQRLLTTWVLVVIPALAAQLSLIAFQIPGLLRTTWQMIKKLALGTGEESRSLLGMVSAGMHILFLLLPVAGLAMLAGLATRGIIRRVRRRRQRRPRHARQAAPPAREVHRGRTEPSAPGAAGVGAWAKRSVVWAGRRAPKAAAATAVALSLAVAYGVTQLPGRDDEPSPTAGAPSSNAPAMALPAPGAATPRQGGPASANPAPDSSTDSPTDRGGVGSRQQGGAEAASASSTADKENMGGRAESAKASPEAGSGSTSSNEREDSSESNGTRDDDAQQAPKPAPSPSSSVEDDLCLDLDQLGPVDVCLGG